MLLNETLSIVQWSIFFKESTEMYGEILAWFSNELSSLFKQAHNLQAVLKTKDDRTQFC